ncbi:DEAD/DEAH box helicase [Aquipuribacter sp. SD81]|uniref:DEAD/DEAH box helicase n=1 Tax=Aquipuribacter sp. SD81 TaxID=3127703 RepID=UPI0030167FE2
MSGAHRPVPQHQPEHPSTAAAAQLPPAFPERAAWGTAGALRRWQREALEAYRSRAPRDFLAAATPGAGKTTFALRVATELLAARTVERVVVVCPTEHLKTQWADAASRVGVRLDPSFRSTAGTLAAGYDGVVVTYAQVGLRPHVFAGRCRARRTLVVLDEIHHAGDARSWGDGVAEAFEDAERRLALTGTPFRSDTSPIPFVTYVQEPDGSRRSRPDWTYGYGDALADGVVRPVLFLAYAGNMRWRTRAGDEVAARLGEPLTKDLTAQALRTALDPVGQWVPAVLGAADRRLTEVRRTVPDAGGLVIATDQASARAYAALLHRLSGERPTVVLSDDPDASAGIESFAAAGEEGPRWMVAVRMVSEGVDVPRLSVGVWATTTATPLFFAQAVGRFVRARRRGETASVFLPSVPQLLRYAAELEVARDHVLDRPRRSDPDDLWSPEEELLAEARAERSTPGAEELPFEALESDAAFDRAVYDGDEFTNHTSWAGEDDGDGEQALLALPGLVEADEMGEHLRRRPSRAAAAPPAEPVPVVDHRAVAAARKELSGLVGAYARRTGSPHAVVHARLRSTCGGPPVPEADLHQVRARVDTVRRWLLTG